MPHKVSLYGYAVCVLCHAGHSEVGSVKQWNMKQPRHGTDQRRLSLLLLGGDLVGLSNIFVLQKE
ncbi:MULTISPECIES: hypothetical protein [Geobacillus]|uniref:Uncharacterized protein n=3 Tax=Geobacillus TaxID=129337 RepID=A0A1Q5SLV1_9BACL|nr:MULTISPECIES: hypothetical protein [Geobacillus]MED4877714.1 hypothetical protein [Anoxybacillus geothermalis]AWO75945.1 hypothetical protein C1N76_16440 [Geobacillus thermoleovorans]ESU71070.1 hypothetical protein T260_15525 [Geobacillus sp. MAS1]MBW7644410.1 hypothetical protein [Geobacillus thermoleovorans]MED4924140.1 hypothetical protein [Anoxybacillus geothermalis]